VTCFIRNRIKPPYAFTHHPTYVRQFSSYLWSSAGELCSFCDLVVVIWVSMLHLSERSFNGFILILNAINLLWLASSHSRERQDTRTSVGPEPIFDTAARNKGLVLAKVRRSCIPVVKLYVLILFWIHFLLFIAQSVLRPLSTAQKRKMSEDDSSAPPCKRGRSTFEGAGSGKPEPAAFGRDEGIVEKRGQGKPSPLFFIQCISQTQSLFAQTIDVKMAVFRYPQVA
jgi:hypothetical protein